jgi:hypothetical protein
MSYSAKLTEILKERVGKKYQPGSGTEGASFMDEWCSNCAHDKPMSEGKDFDDCSDDELCKIIADTFSYKVDDPKYPKEWQYDKDGQPCCTAFVPVGDSIHLRRCTATIDMFEEMRP